MAKGKRGGPGSEKASGVQKGLKGKAAGGKSVNSALKGKAPSGAAWIKETMTSDAWVPGKYKTK